MSAPSEAPGRRVESQAVTVRKVKLTVDRCRCERCGHQFTVVPPRKMPARCPRCKAAGWSEPAKAGNYARGKRWAKARA